MAYLIHHMDQSDDQELMYMPDVKVHNEEGFQVDGYHHYQSVTFVVINDDLFDKLKNDLKGKEKEFLKSLGWLVDNFDKEELKSSAIIEKVVRHALGK